MLTAVICSSTSDEDSATRKVWRQEGLARQLRRIGKIRRSDRLDRTR
jgi:hypothetical protein